MLLEEIEASLGSGQEGDFIRAELISLRRDFNIEDDVTQLISDYDKFKDRLEKLRYAGRLATQDSEVTTFGTRKSNTIHADDNNASVPEDGAGVTGENKSPQTSPTDGNEPAKIDVAKGATSSSKG